MIGVCGLDCGACDIFKAKSCVDKRKLNPATSATNFTATPLSKDDKKRVRQWDRKFKA